MKQIIYYEIQAGSANSVANNLRFKFHENFEVCVQELERAISLSKYVKGKDSVVSRFIDENRIFEDEFSLKSYRHEFLYKRRKGGYYIEHFDVVAHKVFFHTLSDFPYEK